MLCIADFVNALSAPLQFLSQVEKRAKLMADMGIDEKDISEVPVASKKKTSPEPNNTGTKPPSAVNTTSTPGKAPSVGHPPKKEEKKGWQYYVDNF